MSPGRLQDRVAIITGSSGRLGRAISLLFASEGAKLFLVDKYASPRNPINASTGRADDWETRLSSPSSVTTAETEAVVDAERTLPTLELIRSKYPDIKAEFHEADLTSEPSVQEMIKRCRDIYTRIDILINAHGISVESTHPTPLPIHLTPLSQFNLTISINTTSVFLTTKHFLSSILPPQQTQKYESGTAWIVNIASVQAITPYYGTPSYCASKGGVLMLTKQVALDYAVAGVRCSAVCPGFLDSEMTGNLKADGEKLGEVEKRHPLGTGWWDGEGKPGMGPGKGGMGKVEDVARMVLVLASDDARWVTGQGVVVDGGYSIS